MNTIKLNYRLTKLHHISTNALNLYEKHRSLDWIFVRLSPISSIEFIHFFFVSIIHTNSVRQRLADCVFVCEKECHYYMRYVDARNQTNLHGWYCQSIIYLTIMLEEQDEVVRTNHSVVSTNHFLVDAAVELHTTVLVLIILSDYGPGELRKISLHAETGRNHNNNNRVSSWTVISTICGSKSGNHEPETYGPSWPWSSPTSWVTCSGLSVKYPTIQQARWMKYGPCSNETPTTAIQTTTTPPTGPNSTRFKMHQAQQASHIAI